MPMWILELNSPPKTSVRREVEANVKTADAFISALYAWGLAGLQKIDGEIIAVKPLTLTVYRKVVVRVQI